MDIEYVLDDIDVALTDHFFTGRGWIGYTLLMPEAYSIFINEISKSKRYLQIRRLAMKMSAAKGKGILTLNLTGKVIPGQNPFVKIPIFLVTTIQKPKVVKDSEVMSYQPKLPALGWIKEDSNIIDPDLMELAALKGIETEGKTKEDIMKELEQI